MFDDMASVQVKPMPHHTPWYRSIFSPSRVNDGVFNHTYTGSGMHENPFVVNYLSNDSEDGMNFSAGRKWAIALSQAFTFFTLTFGSSVYAPGVPEVMLRFHVSIEVAILGVALYVLGFAIGPIIWAPMSEVYGRRLTFIFTFTIYMAFTIAAPFSPNIRTLLVLRFFASAFGSSAQINPGGAIADMFPPEQRGPVMAVFAACPFLGPAFGK